MDESRATTRRNEFLFHRLSRNGGPGAARRSRGGVLPSVRSTPAAFPAASRSIATGITVRTGIAAAKDYLVTSATSPDKLSRPAE